MRPVQIIAADIEHLTDARYFAAHEVDFISFKHKSTENQESGLNHEEIMSISQWIEGPKIIVPCNEIEIFNGLNVEACFFESRQELDYTKELSGLTRFKLRKIENFNTLITEGVSGTDMVIHADHLILDFRVCGLPCDELLNGENLDFLQAIAAATSLFIDVSCDIETLMKLINQINPEGIVIRGGAEERAGYKSFDELDELFEILSTESV
jgi:phosphoribosylanthranilate isomerase